MKITKQFKFICSIVIWGNILSRNNLVSKLLQSTDYDISQDIEPEFFENLKSNESELGSEDDVDSNFETTTTRHCVRSKTKTFLYDSKLMKNTK